MFPGDGELSSENEAICNLQKISNGEKYELPTKSLSFMINLDVHKVSNVFSN